MSWPKAEKWRRSCEVDATTYSDVIRLTSKPITLRHLLTFLTFSLFSYQALAQFGTITSLTVSPPDPTVNDEVVIYANVSFTSGDCPLDDSGFGLNGTDITAYAHHCVGALAVICPTTDTFELGQLGAGAYTFDYTLTSGAGWPSCSPGIVPDDNDQLQFVVSTNVGIEEVESLEDIVYPNPFANAINLKRPLSSTSFIVDASGKYVTEIPSGTKQIDLSHLPNGVYVLNFRSTKLKLVKVN